MHATHAIRTPRLSVPEVTITWDLSGFAGFAGTAVGIAAIVLGLQARSRLDDPGKSRFGYNRGMEGSSHRRAAVVTGAASGIGRAIAERLENDGLDVLAVDLDPEEGGPGAGYAADLTTREGNRGAIEAAVARFGRLDVIVANAGVQHVAPISEFPEERWEAMISLLLTSPFLLARYGWEALGASGDGRFVAIASAHALAASPFKSAYVAAKHGVLGLVKTLALEGAEAGILATAVCPGFVRTPLVESQLADQAKARGIPEDRVLEEVILEPHAVKRLLEPEEVAATVSFLVGPDGRGFTGVPVTMDLGWTAR